MNAGYLLRLSIVTDVSKLDPNIGRDFYPELFDNETGKVLDQEKLDENLLFDGRALVSILAWIFSRSHTRASLVAQD